MNSPDDRPHETPRTAPPSLSEIAALTARLRQLAATGADAAEREAVLAWKDALLARLPDHLRDRADHDTASPRDQDDRQRERDEAVLAHLHRARELWGAAGRLHDMPPREWNEAITSLRAAGHTIDTTTLTQGDRASNETGYVLREDRSEDGDDWFSGGYDAAHQAHLDALGHVDVDVPDTAPGYDADDRDVLSAEERRLRATYPSGMPLVLLDGIDRGLTDPAQLDDAEELAARLNDYRAHVTGTGGTPPGGWQTLGAESAAHRLTAFGADLDTARAMVADYLRETSERAGAPVYAWGLDQGDLDAIAAERGLPTRLPPVVALAHLTAERDDDAQGRADQLTRWHTDDHAATDSTDTADATDTTASGGFCSNTSIRYCGFSRATSLAKSRPEGPPPTTAILRGLVMLPCAPVGVRLPILPRQVCARCRPASRPCRPCRRESPERLRCSRPVPAACIWRGPLSAGIPPAP